MEARTRGGQQEFSEKRRRPFGRGSKNRADYIPSTVVGPVRAVLRTAAELLAAPRGHLAQHLRPVAARPVDQPGTKTVLLLYLVLRHDELKIPRRVGGLPLLVDAAAARRLRQTNPLHA